MHFTSQTEFKSKGYRLYSTEHPSNKARTGSEVIIHENNQSQRSAKNYRSQPSGYRNIQTNQSIITIAATYCPPCSRIDHKQFEAFVNSLENHFIIGGDYNSKHT